MASHTKGALLYAFPPPPPFNNDWLPGTTWRCRQWSVEQEAAQFREAPTHERGVGAVASLRES